MDMQFASVWLYAFIPACAMLIGGSVSLLQAPSQRIASYAQHFAAGIVFAAVALELIPKVSQTQSSIPLTIGFLIGLGIMLLIKEVAEHHHDESTVSLTMKLPLNMLTGVGIDLFIDGLLVGLAFITGNRGGILITIALTAEILFLGFATGSRLTQHRLYQSLPIILLLSITIPGGALTGIILLDLLPLQWLTGILAFGISALLYLVTEELLVSAHSQEDTPLTTSAFFIGFLVILLIDTHI